MIEHLYSQKKAVVKSEFNNEDLQARKEDESFLDTFLPNKDDSIELEKKESKHMNQKGSKVSDKNSRTKEIERKTENNLVRILDEELIK